MTPFFGTPDFLPALHSTVFGPWYIQEHRRNAQVLQSDPLLTVASSSTMLSYNPAQWLQRHQALCYIQSIPSKQDIYAKPTAFESLLLQEEPISHSVSALYSILLLSTHSDLPPYTRKWEKTSNRL